MRTWNSRHIYHRYLDDFRKHLKVLKKTTASGLTKKDRKKEEKRIETKRSHLKALVKYVDKDYAEVKRRYANLVT